MQKMLIELASWGSEAGLKFNASKTVVIFFSRRKKVPPYKLKLNGDEIEYSSSTKYLGVTLDKGMYWQEHINNKLDKAKKLMLVIKKTQLDPT